MITENFNLNKIRDLKDRELVGFLKRLYTEGYKEGHRQTVESCYTDVYSDDDNFHDEVGQFVIWYFPEDTPELLTPQVSKEGGENENP